MSADELMRSLPSSCLVCGAPLHEVGASAGAWSTCPFQPDDDGDEHAEPDAWERARCLDDVASQAEIIAWLAERQRRIATLEESVS